MGFQSIKSYTHLYLCVNLMIQFTRRKFITPGTVPACAHKCGRKVGMHWCHTRAAGCAVDGRSLECSSHSLPVHNNYTQHCYLLTARNSSHIASHDSKTCTVLFRCHHFFTFNKFIMSTSSPFASSASTQQRNKDLILEETSRHGPRDGLTLPRHSATAILGAT